MRPCLEHISQNAGDQIVEKYMQSILPMSIKCKLGKGDIINNKEEKEKFRACMKVRFDPTSLGSNLKINCYRRRDT